MPSDSPSSKSWVSCGATLVDFAYRSHDDDGYGFKKRTEQEIRYHKELEIATPVTGSILIPLPMEAHPALADEIWRIAFEAVIGVKYSDEENKKYGFYVTKMVGGAARVAYEKTGGGA